MQNTKRKLVSGFTMLEILIGVSILVASFLGVLTVFDRLNKSSRAMVEFARAGFLLEEGVEAVRLIRDNNWNNFSAWPTDTTYYLTWSSGQWATSTVNTFIDGLFERQAAINSVARDDSTNDIIPPAGSGGTDDPETKSLTLTVSWRLDGATTTRSLSAYFTNLFD